jgi:hypothetical protein
VEPAHTRPDIELTTAIVRTEELLLREGRPRGHTGRPVDRGKALEHGAGIALSADACTGLVMTAM